MTWMGVRVRACEADGEAAACSALATEVSDFVHLQGIDVIPLGRWDAMLCDRLAWNGMRWLWFAS